MPIILEMPLSKKLKHKIMHYTSTLAKLKSEYLLRCALYLDISLFVFLRRKFT